MRFSCVLVFAVACLTLVKGSENNGVSVALKLYEECSNNVEGFSPCIKKKAVTLLDRLGRMQKLTLTEGITIVHTVDKNQPVVTEDQLDATLPRGLDARDAALNDIVYDKISKFISSSTLEVSPRLIEEEIEEGRDGGLGGGGGKKGGGGGGKGKKDMMGGMMMMIAAKMAGLIPIAIAGLFLLAGKALITAKIALLLAGIIALKKLFASKHSQPHVEHVHASHHGGWQPSGGGGGGHGGWDKRSLDGAQNLAYSAHSPQ